MPSPFTKSLVKELLEASQGQENSIKYLKSDLTRKSLVQEGELFQVIMIGGSHLESALVKFEKGEFLMLNFKETEIEKLTTNQIFFDYIENFLEPEIKIVALNFAYPIAPFTRDGRFDGKLVAKPKGHTFKGLYQKNVGEELEKYFLEKGREINFTICNDTTAIGLSSFDWTDFRPEDSITGVVGTGFNFGLFENKKTFVNLELGNFNKFEQTKTGKIIDDHSNNKGFQLLEKEVGGGYLYQHFNYLVKESGSGLEIKNTKELSILLATGKFADKEHALQVYKCSAEFVAGTIFGLYEFKKIQNKFENFKMLVLIEGSLYWKGYQFKEMVNQKLLELGMDLNNLKIDQTRKIGLKGAARLVLAG
jgi:hexokinase